MTSNENPDRRRVLKAIGAGTATVTASSMSSVAKETTGHSGSDSIHHDEIGHDFEVFNRTSESRTVTISITNPGNGHVVADYEIELDANDATTSSDGHYVKKQEIAQMSGPMTVAAKTDNGFEKSESVRIPPKGRRQFEALSIFVAQDRVMVGKIES